MTTQMDLHPHWDRTIEIFLIVDDDAFDRAQVRSAIERHRPEVQIVEFGTLTAARTYLDRARADLVVLDNRLPDGRGSTFAVELLNREDMARVPIFVVTGDDPADVDHRVIALSKDDLSPDTFLTLLTEYLRFSRERERRAPEDLILELFPAGQADLPSNLSKAMRRVRVARAKAARTAPLSAIRDLEEAEDILSAAFALVSAEQPKI